jgi:hypothetical protein
MILAVFPATPAPGFLRSRVHPLLSFGSSSEFVTASNLPAGRSHRAPPMRSLSSSATSVQGIHLPTGIPPPVYGPPSVFLTLSTAYSSLNLTDLFHSATTPEVHPAGGFPDTQPPRLIAKLFSPDLLATTPCSEVALSAPGLEDGPPELSSGHQSVDSDRVVTSDRASIPS